MYDKILCIYPIDQTTDFLFPIPTQLKKEFGDKFELFRLDSSEDSRLLAIYKMETCSKNTLIIYLGHGSSAGFHCIDDNSDENVIFINSQNIKRIQEKHIFAFSCNSALFLKKFSSNTNSWMGFDDLPTENNTFPINDEDESNKFKLLALYQKILLEAVILSLFVLIKTGTFSISFSSLKLVLNKNMIQLASAKSNQKNHELAELIFKTKKGIDFIESF